MKVRTVDRVMFTVQGKSPDHVVSDGVTHGRIDSGFLCGFAAGNGRVFLLLRDSQHGSFGSNGSFSRHFCTGVKYHELAGHWDGDE